MHGSLGFPIKAVYGAGQIASAMKTVLFGLFSLYFYTTVLGLSGTLVGIASALGLVWDAAIDPLIGAISDRTRSAFGRRHLFMLVGSVGMGPSFWMFFSPPAGLSQTALFAWLLGANFLVRTTMSIFCIPYYALGSEMSQDYDERTSITGIRGALGLLGTMATAVLSFVLFFPSPSHGGDPKLHVEGYRVMGAACGAVMTLASLAATLGTLSFRQTVSGEEAGPRIWDRLADFWSGMGSALRNGSFRIVLSCYSLFFLGVVVNGTLAVHFLTYYVRITDSREVSAFQLAFYIGALVGVALWLRISRNVEKHRLLFLGTLGTAAVMGCAFFLVGEGRPFGAANLPPLLVGHGLAGFFASILWMIPTSMLADVVDEDALSTGGRREGTFFGLFHFGEQIAAGFAILVTGLLVDRFAGLVPGQSAQSSDTVLKLGILYSLLPAGLLALASLPLLGYSLDRCRVASIQKLLASSAHLAKAGADLRERRASGG